MFNNLTPEQLAVLSVNIAKEIMNCCDKKDIIVIKNLFNSILCNIGLMEAQSQNCDK